MRVIRSGMPSGRWDRIPRLFTGLMPEGQRILLRPGQLNFLRPNVVVHLRKGLQPLHLVREQTIHFIKCGLPQRHGPGFGHFFGGLEHGWKNPPGNVFGINAEEAGAGDGVHVGAVGPKARSGGDGGGGNLASGGQAGGAKRVSHSTFCAGSWLFFSGEIPFVRGWSKTDLEKCCIRIMPI